MAIRILPGNIPTIEELNLHSSLHDISKIKSGLVLICGSTGVGKTTTIAAIINDINKYRQAHIITLEDPIEYRFQSKNSFIEQRELGSHVPSFEQGLIDVLREDPDVIIVGELRDGKLCGWLSMPRSRVTWSLPLCMQPLRKKPSTACAMLCR